jgi:hypothetical protein
VGIVLSPVWGQTCASLEVDKRHLLALRRSRVNDRFFGGRGRSTAHLRIALLYTPARAFSQSSAAAIPFCDTDEISSFWSVAALTLILRAVPVRGLATVAPSNASGTGQPLGRQVENRSGLNSKLLVHSPPLT